MADAPPNILYLHSHDTGRYVQPYGYPVPTPNIQRLADQGVLFREAFCAVPTCSGSRACLLTGQYGHSSGMMGLAHRGWSLNDYHQHIVHVLREAGYHSVLIGEQHIAKRPDIIGFDRIEKIPTSHVDSVAPVAREVIGEPIPQPFFPSVGFFETHRDWLGPSSVRDALYSLPPANLPDTPETRRDVASYKSSARTLDQGVGAVSPCRRTAARRPGKAHTRPPTSGCRLFSTSSSPSACDDASETTAASSAMSPCASYARRMSDIDVILITIAAYCLFAWF
jgi:N-sulfoglucosamine sulfohydrolase